MAGLIWVSVDVSRNAIECNATVATNLLFAARAIQQRSSRDLIFWMFDAAEISWPSLDHANGMIAHTEAATVLMVMSLSLLRLLKTWIGPGSGGVEDLVPVAALPCSSRPTQIVWLPDYDTKPTAIMYIYYR